MVKFKFQSSLFPLAPQVVLMDGVLPGRLGKKQMKRKIKLKRMLKKQTSKNLMDSMKSTFVLNILQDLSKKYVQPFFMKWCIFGTYRMKSKTLPGMELITIRSSNRLQKNMVLS